MDLSRRTLLALGASVLLGAACSDSESPSGPTATTEYDPIPRPDLSGASEYTDARDPFTLGVSSGDPDPHRVVLWTRLAPDPTLASGGLDDVRYLVTWEVAIDEGFEEVTFSGTTVAEPGFAHSVHVDVKELEPSVSFWYRFRAGPHTSPVGRTATMPLFTLPDRALIGTVIRRGDASAIAPLLADLASSGLELVVDLGDPVAITEGTTLEEYRVRYTNLLADASSAAARAACAWLAIPNSPGPSVDPDAARQAWWEHTPVRLPPPNSDDPYPAYRHCLVGSLVDIALLHPTVDGSGRARLGRAQERWLTRVPARANAVWHAVAYRGDATVGERATQLLTGASIRNIVPIASSGAAPDGSISWQRHEVTPERWTSVTHLLDTASGRITVSDTPTELVASPSPAPAG